MWDSDLASPSFSTLPVCPSFLAAGSHPHIRWAPSSACLMPLELFVHSFCLESSSMYPNFWWIPTSHPEFSSRQSSSVMPSLLHHTPLSLSPLEFNASISVPHQTHTNISYSFCLYMCFSLSRLPAKQVLCLNLFFFFYFPEPSNVSRI